MIRLWFYRALALLSLAWIAFGWAETSKYNVSHVVDSTGGMLGQAVGSMAAMAVFWCTGLPLFFIFALLAWRMQVHRRETKRHEDKMRALRRARQHGE